MHKHYLLATLLLLNIACGGDDGTTVTEGDADVRPAADAGVTDPPEVFAYALGSDGTTSGILSQIAMKDLSVAQGVTAGVATNDSVVRRSGNKLYIVNRLGSDNVTIIDTDTMQLVAQISTGSGTNPQDVAVIGNSIYVCAFNSGNIIVLDESNEQATPTFIDISSYDPDGVPNCASIIEIDGTLYAALGLLDNEFTSHGGKIVVIDSATNTISSDFDLVNNNPFSLFEASASTGPFQGDLLIATTEDFGVGNGCVERITTGTTPASAGCLIQNAALDGFVSKIQIVGDSAIVGVSTSFTEAKLVRVDSSGTLNEMSITPAGHQVTDFATCPSGDLITSDRTQGTIRVYGSDDIERTEAIGLDIGLPTAYTNGIVCF